MKPDRVRSILFFGFALVLGTLSLVGIRSSFATSTGTKPACYRLEGVRMGCIPAGGYICTETCANTTDPACAVRASKVTTEVACTICSGTQNCYGLITPTPLPTNTPCPPIDPKNCNIVPGLLCDVKDDCTGQCDLKDPKAVFDCSRAPETATKSVCDSVHVIDTCGQPHDCPGQLKEYGYMQCTGWVWEPCTPGGGGGGTSDSCSAPVKGQVDGGCTCTCGPPPSCTPTGTCCSGGCNYQPGTSPGPTGSDCPPAGGSCSQTQGPVPKTKCGPEDCPTVPSVPPADCKP